MQLSAAHNMLESLSPFSSTVANVHGIHKCYPGVAFVRMGAPLRSGCPMVPDLLEDQWSGPAQWTVGSDQFGDCSDGPRPVQGVRTNGLDQWSWWFIGTLACGSCWPSWPFYPISHSASQPWSVVSLSLAPSQARAVNI